MMALLLKYLAATLATAAGLAVAGLNAMAQNAVDDGRSVVFGVGAFAIVLAAVAVYRRASREAIKDFERRETSWQYWHAERERAWEEERGRLLGIIDRLENQLREQGA